jgi:hypothetical protein
MKQSRVAPLALLLCVVSLLAIGWYRSRTTLTAVSAPAAPAVPPKVERKKLFVDLDRPGGTVELGRNEEVDVYLRALIPAGRYRLSTFMADRPPLAIVHETQRFTTLLPLGPVCEARQKAAQAIPEAESTAAAVTAIQEFQAAPAAARCPQMEATLQSLLDQLSPVVASGINAGNAQTTRIKIERLDPSDPNLVLATWEWSMALSMPREPATEEASIALGTASRINELLGGSQALTIKATTASPRPTVFEIGGAPHVFSIDMRTGAWSPRSFAPLVNALVSKEAGAPGGVISSNLIEALATPGLSVFLTLNDEVGAALKADPFNARTHEAAALLVGSVALRAPLISYGDSRHLVDATVAHLAIADARSRGRLGTEGELALVILDLLVGRDVSALQRIRNLSSRLPGATGASWSRALQMRANGDWRVYSEKGASRLEHLEYVRALARSWSAERAAGSFQSSSQLDEVALECEALMAKENGVEVGNQLAQPCLVAELATATLLAGKLGASDPERWWLAPTQGDVRAPITHEMWRRSSEGLIADALWKFDHHLEELAQPGQRAIFQSQTAKRFERSVLVRTLASQWASMAAAQNPFCASLMADIDAEPSRLSVRAWQFARAACDARFPKESDWFSPWTPSGTLFDHRNRLELLLASATQTDLDSMRRMAFYEPMLLFMSHPGREPVSADFAQYRTERAYSLRLMQDWARVTSVTER